MTGRAFERGESSLILLSEAIKLLGEHATLRGRAADEELAHEVAGQPDILAQGGEGFVLFDEMAVDFEMLAGDVELNAVGFEGGKDQYGDHRAESGTQARTFAPAKGHPPLCYLPCGSDREYDINRMGDGALPVYDQRT